MDPCPKPGIPQVVPWLVTPGPFINQFCLVPSTMCTSFILQQQHKILPYAACIASMNKKPTEVTSPEGAELKDALVLLENDS